MTFAPTDIPAGARYSPAPDMARLRRLRRFLFAALGYGALCVLLVIGAWVGTMSGRAVAIVCAFCLMAHLALYAAFYTNATAHWKEPTGALAHLFVGFCVVALCCALIPEFRGVALQVFFLIIAYDAARLSRLQIAVASGLMVCGLALSPLNAWLFPSGEHALQDELLNFVMAVAYLPALMGIGHVVRSAQQRQRRQKEALETALSQLQALSERDVLTGATNRRQAMVLFEHAQTHQRQTRQPLSVCLLDIDFFKQINDHHGHAVGDRVLRGLVELARESLAGAHTVARWGGEEFLILMLDTPVPAAVQAMNRLRERLRDHDWASVAPGVQVDVSVGVYGHRPDDTLSQALERVDQALYAAKQQGRGRVVQYRA
ncbi:GGDEF domain-containing protein [Variovorax ginsengisoli]|uniref:diguanylate cyclase n=1 Tax=Variovorax ginsengisoli TaxID=363844 RepID=A0ABT9S4V3_9BURK|nr:GGDEF domain-containing protein [Variovorax ginsengisoli]MDP9899255.1 diguanylate cyclase (GGDEF)-like protein [Variovorax ginsengisoli]